jgi:uncharacterized membrane protein
MGEPTDDDSISHGMWDNNRAYSTTNLAVIVAASFIVAVAVMFILLREEYVPLPPSMITLPPPPVPARREETGVSPGGPRPEMPEEDFVGKPAEEAAAEENYLVLRLLSGDERTMFKAIMDAGGEALQKDLIQRTKMSNAKVSRVLEKLEQKGVVSKERFGSTNKIKIRLRT